MRGVIAKRLRKLAQQQTVGQANVEHMDAGRKVTRNVRGKEHTFWASRCELSARCTRSVYRKFKRMYKEIARAGR